LGEKGFCHIGRRDSYQQNITILNVDFNLSWTVLEVLALQTVGEVVDVLVGATPKSTVVIQRLNIKPINEHVHFGEQFVHAWAWGVQEEFFQGESGVTDDGEVPFPAGGPG
jgi:hypothetical protein